MSQDKPEQFSAVHLVHEPKKWRSIDGLPRRALLNLRSLISGETTKLDEECADFLTHAVVRLLLHNTEPNEVFSYSKPSGKAPSAEKASEHLEIANVIYRLIKHEAFSRKDAIAKAKAQFFVSTSLAEKAYDTYRPDLEVFYSEHAAKIRTSEQYQNITKELGEGTLSAGLIIRYPGDLEH